MTRARYCHRHLRAYVEPAPEVTLTRTPIPAWASITRRTAGTGSPTTCSCPRCADTGYMHGSELDHVLITTPDGLDRAFRLAAATDYGLGFRVRVTAQLGPDPFDFVSALAGILSFLQNDDGHSVVLHDESEPERFVLASVFPDGVVECEASAFVAEPSDALTDAFRELGYDEPIVGGDGLPSYNYFFAAWEPVDWARVAARLIGALKLLGADENSPICVNAFPRTPFAIDH